MHQQIRPRAQLSTGNSNPSPAWSCRSRSWQRGRHLRVPDHGAGEHRGLSCEHAGCGDLVAMTATARERGQQQVVGQPAFATRFSTLRAYAAAAKADAGGWCRENDRFSTPQLSCDLNLRPRSGGTAVALPLSDSGAEHGMRTGCERWGDGCRTTMSLSLLAWD